MRITRDTVVSMDYTLTGPNGNVIDTSQGREPLVYMQGAGNVIPGLERELEGKSAGDQINVTIAAKDAYGERDDRMMQSVPREMFKGVDNIQPGMQFQANGPNGERRMVTVAKVEPDTVTVDANHPLAGMPLTFDVKVVDVRDATAEEKSHGHAHEPGGHEHH
ncbi:MAG: peptidylprolyl isomerase [Anaerolineae bacterium]|nr:peptidylprolyl isomerase [Phycisphaerae bacterium]